MTEEIIAPQSTSRLAEAELSQPCCSAIQIALVDLLRSWGITPSGVVGHSSGEIAAAYACGAITAPDAMRIAYYRGQCTLELKEMSTTKGGMAAIGLGRAAVEPYLQPGVTIGCENSPASVTLTGDANVLEAVLNDIRAAAPTALVRALRVEFAYHSEHMKAAAGDYAARLGTIEAAAPQVPFYSSVAAGQVNQDLSTAYWVENLVSPVLFKSAVQTALRSQDNVTFVEVGPHSALAGPIRQTVLGEVNEGAEKAEMKGGKKPAAAEYISTLVRDADAYESMLNTAGQLWLAGAPTLDLGAVEAGLDGGHASGQLLTDLPTYSWHYDGSYWLENRLSRDWRLRPFDHHELLGARVLESGDAAPTWRCKLRVQDVPWLSDHDILGDIIFPGAGYLCMAGEAVKQLRPGINDSGNGNGHSYSLRRVTLSAALVLQDEHPVELITTLAPVRLTTSADSAWYNFTITSVHPVTNVWTKHVSGQVRAGRDGGEAAAEVPPVIESLPRKVPTASMYSIWRRFGLNYGGRFRGLADISAHTTETRAAGTIYDKCTPEESAVYSVHPAGIDAAFHLSNVCLCHGLGRNFRTPSVPKYIEAMYVAKPGAGEAIHVMGDAASKGRGGSTSNLIGVADGDGRVVLSWTGLELSPLSDGSEVVDADPHAAAVLSWQPDIDFLDSGRLLRSLKKDPDDALHRLVDTMGLACIVESRHQLLAQEAAGVDVTPSAQNWHLAKFRDWLDIPYREAVAGTYPHVPDCQAVAAMASADRIALIEAFLAASAGTEANAVAISMHRIYANCVGFFTGTAADPLEVLMADNILMRMYDFTNNADHVQFLGLLGHKKPTLRVLEIGAGTGGTTATVLAALRSDQGERLYGSYVYSDISAGFFPGAKARFHDCEAIEYAVLDITQDPVSQGFAEGSFDLIVSSNCLHATPNLVKTLTNVRKLLRPDDGRLFLMELSPEASKSVNFVMGPLVGWWLSEDGREDEPYVGHEVWHERLQEAGFAGIEAYAFDGNMSNSIIARPAPSVASPTAPLVAAPPVAKQQLARVSIVCGDPRNRAVAEATTFLQDIAGLGLDVFQLGQPLPPGQPVVFLMDVEAPFLASVTADHFNAFKESLFASSATATAQDSNISFCWVTGACQIACTDPNYALVNGMARSIRQETGIDFVTLELERFDESGWRGLASLLATFPTRVTDPEVDVDTDFESEYAVHGGLIHVGRMHWIKILDELQDRGQNKEQENEGEQSRAINRLVIDKPGIMQTLHWQQQSSQSALEADNWVRVATRAVGLNFKVRMVLGLPSLLGVTHHPLYPVLSHNLLFKFRTSSSPWASSMPATTLTVLPLATLASRVLVSSATSGRTCIIFAWGTVLPLARPGVSPRRSRCRTSPASSYRPRSASKRRRLCRVSTAQPCTGWWSSPG